MEFKTHNQKDIDCNGTSLIGCLDISYKELLDKLGEPNNGDDYKVDAAWNIEFEDGTILTVYNYKDVNYNGTDGTPTEEIRDWHVGGYSNKSLDYIFKYVL